MTIWVAEIKDRSVVAFDTESYEEALAVAEAEWLKEDLMVLESDGVSLWDGKSEIHVREAIEEERNRWDVSRSAARLNNECNDDEDGEDGLMFLVPVSDPTDDDIFEDWDEGCDDEDRDEGDDDAKR